LLDLPREVVGGDFFERRIRLAEFADFVAPTFFLGVGGQVDLFYVSALRSIGSHAASSSVPGTVRIRGVRDERPARRSEKKQGSGEGIH
jgi:hypothetical protein